MHAGEIKGLQQPAVCVAGSEVSDCSLEVDLVQPFPYVVGHPRPGRQRIIEQGGRARAVARLQALLPIEARLCGDGLRVIEGCGLPAAFEAALDKAQGYRIDGLGWHR